MTPRRRTLAVLLLFAVLAAVMTWPLVARLASAAPQHQDVYFNLWRLEWFAHALAEAPRHLFDGNIFYPERGAMTLSDAMFVEGLTAAPLLWLHVPPVLVHNLLVLGAMVLSALGMFVLARRLTSSTTAGVAAGIIFAFAPYRFEHLMHLELQWAMWIPWTFWALDRTIGTGRLTDGAMTGLFAGLQVLSSIYYGVFLALLLVVGVALLLLARRHDRPWRAARALAAGSIVALVVASIYAAPYAASQSHVVGRNPTEVATFSARPSSYLVATPDNFLYGHAFEARGRLERRLFPGTLAVLLALVGLLLRRPTETTIVYFVLLVVSFEMSLGLSGYSYRLLYTYVPVFAGFRAIARLGLFVLFFLAALAAGGMAALEAALPRSVRSGAAVAICGVLLLEYWVVPLHLVSYPNTAPPLYAWLAREPPGVVAEFPMPSASSLPGAEPVYTFMSTFHWKWLVNGYSGYAPPSYLDRLGAVRGFPDDRSIEHLRRDGVRYVLVHPAFYTSADADRVLAAIAERPELRELGRFDDGTNVAIAYQLR